MHFTAIYLFNAHVWDDKRERVYCVFCLFCASMSCFTKLISLPHWLSALNRRLYDPLSLLSVFKTCVSYNNLNTPFNFNRLLFIYAMEQLVP